MSKFIVMAALTVISFAGLTGCDKTTSQKADQAVEAVDAKVEQLAQTPNALQPAAKNVDSTVNAVHSTIHTTPTKTTSPAK